MTLLPDDTVKTTIKLSPEGRDALNFIAKRMQRTKRKVLDYIMTSKQHFYEEDHSGKTKRSILVNLLFDVGFFDEENPMQMQNNFIPIQNSCEYIRATYSMSKQSLNILNTLAEAFGQTRDILLDTILINFKKFVTGEHRLLDAAISHADHILGGMHTEIEDLENEAELLRFSLKYAQLGVKIAELSAVWQEAYSLSHSIRQGKAKS